MRSRILLPVVMALSLAIVPAAIHAGTPAKPRPTPVHHHVTIESVSADSITVDEPGGAKTYKISPHTDITFKNDPATVSQLQAGMRVQVTPDAADETVAGEIQADDPPKDPTPRPSTKKTTN
jgi:hypothetical protein